MFGAKRVVWRRKTVFGGEKGFRGIMGCLGRKWGCFGGERGVWGEKGCLVAKSGVWGRKGVFGIYIFFIKSSLGDKAGPACPGESRLTNTT